MSELKKTITLVDKSTRAFVKAKSDLDKTLAELNGVVGSSEILTQEIEFRQATLDGIEESIKTAERNAAADLKLRIKENEDKVLTELLKARGLDNISTQEVAVLKRDLQEALSDNADAVSKAQAQTKNAVTSSYEAKIVGIEAEQSVETATLKAKIESLEYRTESLQETVTDQRRTLDEERQARIDISKAQTPVYRTEPVVK